MEIEEAQKGKSNHARKSIGQASYMVKPKVKEIYSDYHEVMVRMWIYKTTTGKRKSNTNNSIYHSHQGKQEK